MAKFKTSAQGANKLEVITPFGVTRNAWGFFIKHIFPEFYIDSRLRGALEEKSWPEDSTISRWLSQEHKYLLRETNPYGAKGFVITDGEFGSYWTHATLPDDRRYHMFLDDRGVIYIPHPAQYSYLERLEVRFRYNDLDLHDILVGYSSKEKQIIEGLRDELQCALKDSNLRTPKEIRDAIFPSHKDLPFQNFPETSHSIANNLPGQTRLDFCRKLSDALTKDINGEYVAYDSQLSDIDKGRIEYQMLGERSAYWNILKRDIPQFAGIPRPI